MSNFIKLIIGAVALGYFAVSFPAVIEKYNKRSPDPFANFQTIEQCERVVMNKKGNEIIRTFILGPKLPTVNEIIQMRRHGKLPKDVFKKAEKDIKNSIGVAIDTALLFYSCSIYLTEEQIKHIRDKSG